MARVEALISERTDLRINRQYNDADAVRNELAQMGVQLWDRDRVWSCSTTPPPRSRSERTEDLGNNFYRKAQRFAAREVSGWWWICARRRPQWVWTWQPVHRR